VSIALTASQIGLYRDDYTVPCVKRLMCVGVCDECVCLCDECVCVCMSVCVY
jgi:hypothetical protein